jgi:hypothetical protein
MLVCLLLAALLAGLWLYVSPVMPLLRAIQADVAHGNIRIAAALDHTREVFEVLLDVRRGP